MNLLYQNLYPAALLPWFIMALLELFKGSFFIFLVIMYHTFTQLIVMLHLPGLELSMVEWNRLLHVQRICLLISYGLRNQGLSGGYPDVFFMAISMPLYKVERITSATIHTTALMAFASTSSVFGIFISMIIGVLFTKMKSNMKINWDMNEELKLYFDQRIAYNYLFCLLEWSVSGTNWVSLLLIVMVSCIFNVVIYFQTPIEIDNRQDAWFNPKAMPQDYPYPLNINDAISKCNVAKKVFKPHEL